MMDLCVFLVCTHTVYDCWKYPHIAIRLLFLRYDVSSLKFVKNREIEGFCMYR